MAWLDTLSSAAAKLPLIYYLALNLLLIIFMGTDKFCACHDMRRIPEKTLLGLGLMAGGIGGLVSMQVFHHKTRKPYFWAVFIAAFILHLALWFALCRWLAA